MSGFAPVPVGDLELSDPSPPAPNARGQASLLVRLHGVPLGTLSLLEGHRDQSTDLVRLAVERFGDAVAKHLERDGQPTDVLTAGARSSADDVCAYALPASPRLVTVAVCTLGDDPRLVQTVTSILAQTHRELDLVVVDNRPDTGRARAMLAGLDDPRLRVVDQPRRGLSAARNAAVAAAAGTVIAFTDDDAYADPEWVAQLVGPFDEHADVVCTTGLVLPAELATPAQALFEEFGAFDKGFERAVWALDPAQADHADLGGLGEGGALFPYSAGVYGSGNNMAFRLDWLREQPLFDEALGAGTLARGGEDLDAFLAVMADQRLLVYEPRAVIRHYARSDMAGLRTQMYGYGSGMCAVIVKRLLDGPKSVAAILTRVPAGLRRLLDPRSGKNAAKTSTFPRELAHAELYGYLAGPALYVRSAFRARRGLSRAAVSGRRADFPAR